MSYEGALTDEEDVDGGTSAGDSQVDILDVGQAVLVGAVEESVRGDQRANEGCNTVPGLAELQAAGGSLGVSDDGGVRVGSGLEGSKTASNNECAALWRKKSQRVFVK